MNTLDVSNMAFLWSHTRLVQEFSQILHATQAWRGVVVQPDHHGMQFSTGDVTFGSLRWNGRLDLPVPPELRDRLVADRMAACDPDEACSDRVVWMVRAPADVDRVVWLLRLSYTCSYRSAPKAGPLSTEATCS